MEEYIMGKMVSIAVIFYTFGWLFRASKVEKKILKSNEAFVQQLEYIHANIKDEIRFAQIERDNHQEQQSEYLATMQKLSKVIVDERAIKAQKDQDAVLDFIKKPKYE